MNLVEQHIIKQGHKFWDECDRVCFASKNLYNQGLYRIRQHFFDTGEYLNYNAVQKQLQEEDQVDYRALPAKVGQWTLKLLDKEFISFFNANKAFKSNPKNFLGKPKLPKYKHKTQGRKVVTYTKQAISKRWLGHQIINPSGTTIMLPTKQTNIRQVRIIPRGDYYVIEVVYKRACKAQVKGNNHAAIDIGLNNLATVAFNWQQQGVLINGKPLKSINQFYNKKKAKLQSFVEDKSSNRIRKLNHKRNCKVKDYLHNSSRLLVNHLVALGVSKVIIGKNPNWKQEINIGKRNNENFVKIPHAIFIDQLTYKLQLEGITVVVREESYTSKCSFFDNEPIKKHETYQGKRVKRSWFKTSKGGLVHADWQAALNIGKKQLPKSFKTEVIEGVVVHPLRITPQKQHRA